MARAVRFYKSLRTKIRPVGSVYDLNRRGYYLTRQLLRVLNASSVFFRGAVTPAWRAAGAPSFRYLSDD